MHWWGGGTFLGGMWFWWIFLIALVFVGFWLFSRAGTRGGPRPESPEEILKRRYASGEIDRAEYDRRLADLRK